MRLGLQDISDMQSKGPQRRMATEEQKNFTREIQRIFNFRKQQVENVGRTTGHTEQPRRRTVALSCLQKEECGLWKVTMVH